MPGFLVIFVSILSAREGGGVHTWKRKDMCCDR